ncbi:MAG: hypothetical protein OEZ48_00035 [Candidatus Bathyarchaeota archaeon]|nr:hypothetical protein [Candidatus Bathyarchaeota archaeon]MDH5686244.1 hypothetical protein [Candidatus Bathyarchaeota archaeon]
MTNTKIQRSDVISDAEFQGMLDLVDILDQPHIFFRKRDKSILCLFKAFGKRRGELTTLEVADLEIRGLNLSVTFTLLKKRRKQRLSVRSEKQMPLADPLTAPIVDYWTWLQSEHPDCKYLFPTARYSGLTGILKIKNDSHMSGRQMLRRVKKYNENAWCHLFRETAGAEVVRSDNTIMAAFKVMLRLDLEDEKTALKYVRRYAVDVIRRGVSDSDRVEVEGMLKETPLTEKQREVLQNVLKRL